MADVTTTLVIDLNVRVGLDGAETVCGFEDVRGRMPTVDQHVNVVETESGVHGSGWVTYINQGRRLIYLHVDWARLTV